MSAPNEGYSKFIRVGAVPTLLHSTICMRVSMIPDGANRLQLYGEPWYARRIIPTPMAMGDPNFIISGSKS